MTTGAIEKFPGGEMRIRLSIDDISVFIDVHPDNSLRISSSNDLKVGEIRTTNALTVFVERRENR